ncbi:hypothetical protein D3C85_1485210 [compost metagenome]
MGGAPQHAQHGHGKDRHAEPFVPREKLELGWRQARNAGHVQAQPERRENAERDQPVQADGGRRVAIGTLAAATVRDAVHPV